MMIGGLTVTVSLSLLLATRCLHSLSRSTKLLCTSIVDVEVCAGDVVSEGRGVSVGREWSGMQPSASLLSQQRGKTLVFHFFTCAKQS